MMKEFMLDEGEVLNLYRNKIEDIEKLDFVNKDIYCMYRIHVPVIENDTPESYFERMCIHYEHTTDELKAEFREKIEEEGVDLNELIEGNNDKFKNFSQQLADALLEHWLVYVTQNDKHIIRRILSQNGSSALQDITEMFQKLFKKLKLSQKIAERIRHYVEGYSKTESAYEMVADMSAEILNKCINSAGLEYFTESDFNKLKEANEKSNLGLNLDNEERPNEQKNVMELFTATDGLSTPNYRNYLLWYNRLKVGFVSVCDIPNYDPSANRQLGDIIEAWKTIKD